jgi:hypothetical protein
MKLFLVSDGCYSDYRICGIYTTQEKAELARKLYAADNDVEEWEVDAMPDHPPGLFAFQVIMDREGSVSLVSFYDAEAMPNRTWMPSGNLGVRFYMWAKDEEHAVKIANERRAALVADNVWTTNYLAWERLTNEWRELDGGKV